MNFNDTIGTIGVGLILIAYLANVMGWLSNRSAFFFVLNIAGAGLACYASWLIRYWPFVILEGTWCAVSIGGLLKNLNKRNR